MSANINLNLCKQCLRLEVFPKYGGGFWVVCALEEKTSKDMYGIGQLPFMIPFENISLSKNAENLPIEHVSFSKDFSVPKACPFILEHLMQAPTE